MSLGTGHVKQPSLYFKNQETLSNQSYQQQQSVMSIRNPNQSVDLPVPQNHKDSSLGYMLGNSMIN